MIDSGVDMNCIQEGIIPSKYYEKSIDKLFSTNGTQMKIKYELNNAHVCHDNICFKIPSVLVKNMIEFFGQKVKFKFASKFEIDIDNSLNLVHAKTKHLNSFKQEVDTRKLLDNFLINCCNKKLITFIKY